LLTPTIIISTESSSIVACQNVSFKASTTHEGLTPSYEWFLNDNLISIASTFSSSALSNGYQIYCKMTSSTACKSTPTVQSNTITMAVNPLAQPTVTVSNDTIYASNYSDAQFDYSWYFNGNKVSGAPLLICKQVGSGTYYLVVNNNGCTATSVTKDIICTSPTEDITQKNYFRIYPNPTSNVLNVIGKVENNAGFKIAIFNVLGKKLEEKLLTVDGEDVSTQLNLENYSNGIYMISIYSDNSKQVFKVYKME
ncbi:MAG: T9SS type A sorting domain-containing protein, partial [Saprospiraceae bacterium]|nr:T9SS type A sorting domain-containing protein [Saprospiraceae bacterium]